MPNNKPLRTAVPAVKTLEEYTQGLLHLGDIMGDRRRSAEVTALEAVLEEFERASALQPFTRRMVPGDGFEPPL